ncbi:hypothetical protein JMJ77_0011711 [Colletotrichum scovillei]|uniref:Uncharacterized protein n=1 Tax=Colletotrichum scovillei TaxID=1209932 RepID=A0A9P7QWF1_9PEZI|nr:hypothetical protein JMJ77_0011711 [Colletotrichum scovillei]KAG7045989.1 hypothetical protein JMJ78_0011060 [Colletotrichum scovillei]KAG7063338.1 hypothetical protein JMJ76_0005806 [Colletotrichum scovillei]
MANFDTHIFQGLKPICARCRPKMVKLYNLSRSMGGPG